MDTRSELQAHQDKKNNGRTDPVEILRGMQQQVDKVKTKGLSSKHREGLDAYLKKLLSLSDNLESKGQFAAHCGSIVQLSEDIHALIKQLDEKPKNSSTQYVTDHLAKLSLQPLSSDVLLGSQALITIIEKGSLEFLKKISKDDLLKIKDSQQNNALHLALKISDNHLKFPMIEYILGLVPELLRGPNKDNETPLFVACKKGDLALVLYLKEKASKYFDNNINVNVLQCFEIVGQCSVELYQKRTPSDQQTLSSYTASMYGPSSLSSSISSISSISSSSSSSSSTSTSSISPSTASFRNGR